MLNPQGIVFGWYEGSGSIRDRSPYIPTQRSYHDGALSPSYAHYLEDLLKTNLSDEIKQKIRTAEVGTIILVSKIHSDHALWLKRLSREEIEALNQYLRNVEELPKIQRRILKITQRLQARKKEIETGISRSPYWGTV